MKCEFLEASLDEKPYLQTLRRLILAPHLAHAGTLLTDEEHNTRVDGQYEFSFLVLLGGIRIGMAKYESSGEEIRILQLQIHPDYQVRARQWGD